MEHRIGTCSSCSARFKVPATFRADKAKCKKCGGVVEIGPVSGGGEPAKPAPVPARKPVSKPAAMKPAAKPVAKPAAKPAAKKGDAGAPPTEPLFKQRRPGQRGSSRRGKKQAEKKGIGVGAVLAFVFMVAIIGVGGWLYFADDASDAQAAESDTTASLTQTDGTSEGDAEETAGDEPVEAADPAAALAADGEAPEDPAEEDAEPDAPKAPERKIGDPSTVDLTLLPDQEPLEGTSDEEWTQMNEWMATALDPNSGAPGGRAKKKLIDIDKKAFPVVLNAFKTIDFSTDDGRRDGDYVQRLLEEICRGNNFGWRYTTEPADVYFNKRVVEAWFKAWGQARDSDIGWANLAKREKPKPTDGSDEELDDF